jgi:hypothetical protein
MWVMHCMGNPHVWHHLIRGRGDLREPWGLETGVGQRCGGLTYLMDTTGLKSPPIDGDKRDRVDRSLLLVPELAGAWCVDVVRTGVAWADGGHLMDRVGFDWSVGCTVSSVEQVFLPFVGWTRVNVDQ